MCIVTDKADWKINPELKQTVLSGMDESYTLEEKAIHIYCALCKELRYNEGYFYRDITGQEDYSSELSVEHMESIKPGSEITCYDFTREFCKFVNELDGDIEAVIISEDVNQEHFKMKFYTDNVSVVLDGIRTINGTNDLAQVKNGLKLVGIIALDDKNNILERAIEKVYTRILGNEPITNSEYIAQLKMLPEQEVVENPRLKLEAFAEMMEKQGIKGNEAVQTFVMFNRAEFFGTEIEKSLIAKRIDDNGKERFKRKIVIMQKNDYFEESIYMLDTENIEVTECSSQELDEKIKSGEYIYEDEEYKLDGIGVEK